MIVMMKVAAHGDLVVSERNSNDRAEAIETVRKSWARGGRARAAM